MEFETDEEEFITLTPEQSAMLREAEEAFERGERGYTIEEVMQHARAKVDGWLRTSPIQSA